jgi:hypothetical protein
MTDVGSGALNENYILGDVFWTLFYAQFTYDTRYFEDRNPIVMIGIQDKILPGTKLKN